MSPMTLINDLLSEGFRVGGLFETWMGDLKKRNYFIMDLEIETCHLKLSNLRRTYGGLHAGFWNVLSKTRNCYGNLRSHLSRIQEAGILEMVEGQIKHQFVTVYSKDGWSLNKLRQLEQ